MVADRDAMYGGMPVVPTGWRVIGCSVCGAAHQRSGLPNQDALHWRPESGRGATLLAAVSDGHGSSRSFRSHLGARLAVQAATLEMSEFLDRNREASFSALKRMVEEQLPPAIVRRWHRGVARHLQTAPFTAGELDSVARQVGPAARRTVQRHPALAYGATLLAAFAAEAYIAYLQLGDGDILAVTAAGEVYRPLPADPRLIANHTTSLCLPDAWHDFRVAFQVLSGSPPALILLATDGYANSFADDAGFCQVGSDLLELIRTDGPDAVEASLATWLAEASLAGSGDDITVAVLCHVEALTGAGPPAAAEPTGDDPDHGCRPGE